MRAHRIAIPGVLLVAALTGCSLLQVGTPTAAVGECFDTSTDGSNVEGIDVKPCDEAHVYEAYAVFDYAGGGGDYPGDSAMTSYASDQCDAPFAEYVGIDYDTSVWFSTSITPSADTWASGDREIICALHTEDETPVTGSARNSNE